MIRPLQEPKKSDDAGAPRRVNRWALGCSVAVLVVLATLALAAIFVVQRFHKLQEYAAEIQQEYAQLNRTHPFETPPEGASVAPGRLEAYFRARAALHGAAPEKTRALAERMLSQSDLESIGNFELLSALASGFRKATRAHLDALEAEAMSLDEYLWIHGLTMHGVFLLDRSDPVRERYESVLQRMETLVKAHLENQHNGADAAFSARAFREELQENYGAYDPPAPDRLGKLLPVDDPGCIMDIIGASPSIRGSLQIDVDVPRGETAPAQP